MGKIVRQGVEYGGSSNSADCIKYNDTKSVKEAIDEIKASSSSNPTAASVTFDNTNTGLEAINVQDAVIEVNGKLGNKNTFIIKSSENEKLNANIVIVKYNKMIQIRFDGFKNLTLNTYNTLFVLPDEFKPVGGLFYDCSNPNGDTYRITISTNGTVELFPYTNINLQNACNTFVYISN